ncbi:MAG: hypothetical protein RLY16_940 [Bacteroidota bacterium]|jgi:tetratricopeptide (TPR) repeat protein
MMKQLIIVLLASLFGFTTYAQTAKELQENGRAFLQQADFSNAILVLNRAKQLEPQNIDISKDLALAYYFQKDNNKALEIILPVLATDEADDQCFQIAGNIYGQLGDIKECEKIHKKGLKKFPNSGPLYNDYGEFLYAQQDYTAIKWWEKGIEMDPGFSKNYLNACKYYYLTADKVWCLIYGEIFVNIEPLGNRTPEVKNILLEMYKKMFSDVQINNGQHEGKSFEKAFLQAMNKQSQLASLGITPETLTMIRTRFLLEWDHEYSQQFSFRLFDMYRQFLQEGLFDAYNQWLFGAAQNLAGFQNWTNTNSAVYQEFVRYQRGRIFKIPTGQYYH